MMDTRDVRFDPRVGDTAKTKRGLKYTIESIRTHINSEDIAYLRLVSERNRSRSVILMEWWALKDHEPAWTGED